MINIQAIALIMFWLSGDIAMHPIPDTGEMRRVEHWNVSGVLFFEVLLLNDSIRSQGTKGVLPVRPSLRAKANHSSRSQCSGVHVSESVPYDHYLVSDTSFRGTTVALLRLRCWLR